MANGINTGEFKTFSSLSGINYSEEKGLSIQQEKDNEYDTIYTKVYDADGKLIYEERDGQISDESTTYYYDENGKLASSTNEWYECGSGHGRTENHEQQVCKTTTIYDENGKPIIGTNQQFWGSETTTTTIRYEHNDNGTYMSYADSNNNGKIDKGEYPDYYTADGEYLSEEEYNKQNGIKQDTDNNKEKNIENDKNSWFDGIIDKLKDLFS